MKFSKFTLISICVLALLPVLSLATGGGWTETFNSNPAARGWVNDDTSNQLWAWDSTHEKIEAQWSSLKALTHYSRSVELGTPIDQDQSFNLEFDVTFSRFSVGSFSNYPLAIGLYNSSSSGNRSYNIVEWDYYLGTDDTYGGPNYTGLSVISNTGGYSNSSGAYTFITPAYTLSTGVLYHITLAYNGSTKKMDMTMTANGSSFGSFPSLDLTGVNFELDRVGIQNWFDDTPVSWGGPSAYEADGSVDNIQLSIPLSISESIWTLMGN